MIDFTEFNKLVDLCNAEHWPITTGEIWEGQQIILYNDYGKIVDDAVIHSFSHGNNEGLLETNHLNNCDGYETAEEVFNGWKKMMEEN